MKCCLTALLFLFVYAPSVLGGDNCFPGEKHVLFSPSHRYELTYKEGDRHKEVEPHRLLFRREPEKEPHEFFEFYNEACVHWSPDETYFSISHVVGSNIAEDYIFESGDISHRTDVMGLLPPDVRDYFRKGIDHGYIQTLAWNKDGLYIRAWGDRESNPRSFDATLKCTLERSTFECRKTSNK